jgi:hypothetical protein
MEKITSSVLQQGGCERIDITKLQKRERERERERERRMSLGACDTL